jgi:hypothetical protein
MNSSPGLRPGVSAQRGDGMLGGLAEAVAKHIAAGGPGVAWVLVVYLLLRLHQLTDRQHKANTDTVSVLATIKTLLQVRLKQGDIE